MSRELPRFAIGIDEAGYGPLLGPLCIGSVRIDGPPGALERALGSGTPHLPRIADSKALFGGGKGLAGIEIAALAGLSLARGAAPASVAEIFQPSPDGVAEHPWYGDWAVTTPRVAHADEVAAATAALQRALFNEGAALKFAQIDVRMEGVLNADWEEFPNKAAVHVVRIGGLLGAALVDAPKAHGVATIDRLGGRKSYSAVLAEWFPFRPTLTIEESPRLSRYVVQPELHELDVSFVVDGERASPLVAWASCLAKYAREVLMESLNAGLAAVAPGIKPTAGYWTDGLRYLDDLARLSGDDLWRARLARRR